MLQNITELYGNKLAALDGDIGHTSRISILTTRPGWSATSSPTRVHGCRDASVLLSPSCFGGKLDSYEETLHVKLRKTQIENSPPLDAHRPVSRQYEIEYYRYYGWPAYWEGGAMWGFGGYPVVIPSR